MTGKIASMMGASCVGILIGAAALLWSPLAEAQGTFSISPQTQPSEPAKIDPSLLGSRKGILTKAQGTTVWINGAAYSLAPDALVESNSGESLLASSLKWEGVEFDVQYWLETGSANRQITKLIITFPQ